LITQLSTFVGTSALVIVTPGPDTAVTVNSTLGLGRAAGVCTALGVLCGQAGWTLASSAGIAALLAASDPAFTAVKFAGAVYLALLGFQALRARRRDKTRAPSAPAADGPSKPHGRLAGFRRGLLSDLGNPKMAVFFTSLLPQFGSHFTGLVVLGLVFCAMTFAWLAFYALAIARIGHLIGRSRVRRALDAVTGAALVGLAVRLVTEQP
jgi:threonine/homoserine/homoserine lactone efflux protein